MLWGCYNCMCYIFILPRFFLNVQGLRTLARRRKLCFDTSLNAVTLCTWVNVIHISYFNPRVGVCVIKSYIEYSSLLCCLSLANCIKTKISKLPNMFITNVPENQFETVNLQVVILCWNLADLLDSSLMLGVFMWVIIESGKTKNIILKFVTLMLNYIATEYISVHGKVLW